MISKLIAEAKGKKYFREQVVVIWISLYEDQELRFLFNDVEVMVDSEKRIFHEVNRVKSWVQSIVSRIGEEL